MKPLQVIEGSVETLRLPKQDKMCVAPLHSKPISFECEMPIGDIASAIWLDKASEPSRCSLIIQSKPKINKPKNLKYPNKKRARRAWKKWKRRFGTTPGKLTYFPDIDIDVEITLDI